MEILNLMGIALHEFGKYVYTKKFDTVSFWNRVIHVNIIYTKFFQCVASKYNFHYDIHHIPYTQDEVMVPTDCEGCTIIGSGLISIVFECSKKGKHMIMKTKRRNIDDRVHASLNAIRKIIFTIDKVYSIPTIKHAYFDITTIFYTQLDFLNEINNHKKFKSLCNYTNVHIPELIEEECNVDRIAMTKLNGIPISALSELEKKKCSALLSNAIIHGLSTHGFIHGDLHTGNILFQKDSIGIIDFGLMIQLTQDEKDHLVSALQYFYMNNYNEGANHLMHFIEPVEIKDVLSPEYLEDIKHFIIHTYKKSFGLQNCFHVSDVMDINKKVSKYGLRLASVFTKIVLAFHSIESVFLNLSTTPNDISLIACEMLLRE
jgi:predicted unusual protein kinase regulating ubiquinone biosynthesis (AarF/ABC1/UbiB family)